MKRFVLLTIVAIGAGFLLSACGGGPDQQEAPETVEADTMIDEAEALHTARVESVAMAEAQYDPAAFDSIGWANSEARFKRGSTVFGFSCTDCHGSEGKGDGHVAVKFEYDVPDFTVSDWEYARDIAAIRYRIYVGHESEMPTWGLYGLEYRDIDAVAFYINEVFGKSR